MRSGGYNRKNGTMAISNNAGAVFIVALAILSLLYLILNMGMPFTSLIMLIN
jgi:hypothetical protein